MKTSCNGENEEKHHRIWLKAGVGNRGRRIGISGVAAAALAAASSLMAAAAAAAAMAISAAPAAKAEKGASRLGMAPLAQWRAGAAPCQQRHGE
jgi:hypothetical protein